MGLADAFAKEETIAVRVSEYCRMVRDDERARIIQNAIEANLPRELIAMLAARESPELKAYKETGLTPDKIREMDELYLEKCKELNEARRQLEEKAAEKAAAENDAAEKAQEIEKLESELKAAWDDIALLKQDQMEKAKELDEAPRQPEEKTTAAGDPAEAEGEQKTGKKTAKKPATQKRRPLDMGKVRALREAGWSLKQIGDEMGCSPQTIANALNKEKDADV